MTEEISDDDEFEYKEDKSYRGQVENKYKWRNQNLSKVKSN